MSEFPALRDALVRAAERRRRRRRAVRVTVPAFAVAALLVVFLRPAAEHERNLSVTADAVAQAFAVFSRPQTDADNSLPEKLALAMAGKELDPTLTRRVGPNLYALATHDGSVCLALRKGDNVSGSCAPLANAAGEAAPLQARSAGLYARLLPDGVRDVRITYSRRGVRQPVRDNVLLAELPDDIAAVAWTGPSGARTIARLGSSSLTRLPSEYRCLNLYDPLPDTPEKAAAGAALRSVEVLDATATRAEVKDVRVGPDWPCGRAENVVEVTVRLENGTRDALRILIARAGTDYIVVAVK